MVQTMVYGKLSNTSKRRRKPQTETKQCLFCNSSFRAAKQSKFCSSYCVEQACRRRKEALVEVLAALMLEHSDRLTENHALLVSENTIRSMHTATKFNLMALGYAYDEIGKRWVLQPRLLP